MRVLLVWANLHWVYGRLVQALVKYNPDITFIHADLGLIGQEPEEFLNLVEQCHVVHWIVNVSSAANGELTTHSLELRPSIAGLYHVEDGEQHKIDALTKASLIHVMSTEWLEYLSQPRWNVEKSRIRMIPFGVDSTYFTRKKLTQNSLVPFNIGWFGNISESGFSRKGIDILEQVIAHLANDSFKKTFQFTLAGSSNRNIGENFPGIVRHEGFVDDQRLKTLYGSLNAYAITSRVEGGPVTLLEAMSMAVPVISTNVGMSRDIVVNGENGFVVPDFSYEHFADYFRYLLQNRSAGQRIAKKAWETAQSYDWINIVPRFSQLYRELGGYPNDSNDRIQFRGTIMAAKEQQTLMFQDRYQRYARQLLRNGQIASAYKFAFRQVTYSKVPLVMVDLLKLQLKLSLTSRS